jgi:hypothetical protein
MINKRSKIIVKIIIAMMVLHIVCFFTLNTLNIYNEFNLYLQLFINEILALGCLLLSVFLFLPWADYKKPLKFLLLFFSVCQVLWVIWAYLMPWCGDPALICFW